MPDLNPGQSDPWHLKWMFKKIKYVNMFHDAEQIMKRVQKHPCYLDFLTFQKLPAKVEEKYLELRNERTQAEEYKSYRTQKQLAFIAAMNFYYRWSEISAAVDRTKQNRPTWRLVSEHLFRDPESGKSAIPFSGLRQNVMPLAERHGLLQLRDPKPAAQEKREKLPELGGL